MAFLSMVVHVEGPHDRTIPSKRAFNGFKTLIAERNSFFIRVGVMQFHSVSLKGYWKLSRKRNKGG
jgi:hypothetical protein